ncbi:hypothetical protein CsatB_007103 [Cannabis sativa]
MIFEFILILTLVIFLISILTLGFYFKNHVVKPYLFIFWELLAISVGDKMLNLLVIGCGPAGLALVAESAMLGLNIGLIGPNLPFTNNYGFGKDEFKGRVVKKSGVSYHDLRVESIVGAAKGHSLVACEQNIVISYKFFV